MTGTIAAAAVLVALGALSPVIVLWLPGSWARHVYHEISFELIASERLPPSKVPEEIIHAAMDYTRRQLWLADHVNPYPGKPFDYLVEGVGWCDYAAKVFCKLLAARGLHARYAFLEDQQGVSPHTVTEIYLHGKWHVVDPFFNLVYEAGAVWPSLEEVTPTFVDRLPELEPVRRTTSDWYDTVRRLARQTYPLKRAPQRSKDFLEQKHVFDRIADGYVRLWGRRFACWYQDRFLARQLAAIRNPEQRLWYQARSYHLYGRYAEAEQCYRRLLVHGPSSPYQERVALFFSRLLIRQQRFAEGRNILERFSRQRPEVRWVSFHLALCYEGLDDLPKAIQQLRRYQELHGSRFAVEAARHLDRLRKAI